MVSSSPDTPSLCLVTHAALSLSVRLSEMSCAWSQFQPNSHLTVSEERTKTFYNFLKHFWVLFWWCFNGLQPPVPNSLMLHSYGQQPGTDAGSSRETATSFSLFFHYNQCARAWIWVLLRNQGVQACFLSFTWSINLWAPPGWAPDHPLILTLKFWIH